MKTINRRRKSPSIGKTRWATYAAAGAATALGGSHSLEAEIHYSGPVNAVLRSTWHPRRPESGPGLCRRLHELTIVRGVLKKIGPPIRIRPCSHEVEH